MSGRIVVIGLLTLAATAGGVGGDLPISQEQPEIASQDEDAEETADGDPGQPIDDQVSLIDWRYEDGTFVLRFDTEVPRKIVITEAVTPDSSESGSLAIKRVTLSRGNSTVRITVGAGSEGAGVVITSTEGIDQGRAAFVSTGQGSGSSSSPLAGSSSTVGWIGGSVLALLSVVGAGMYRMRSEAMEPEVAG
jgi:hypothetical protein